MMLIDNSVRSLILYCIVYVFLSPAVVVVTVAVTLYMRNTVKKGKNLDRWCGEVLSVQSTGYDRCQYMLLLIP